MEWEVLTVVCNMRPMSRVDDMLHVTCGDTMDNLQVLLQEALRMALCAAPLLLAQTT